ncbi:MAG: dihydroorotate dehydrogenase-like protein [Bacteroidales bacterium]|nr:dihydroorotate dehydrogenase-like protein [Bacteroidales bacterium]
MNTQTRYLGLTLKSPIIAGSCGLTADIDNLIQAEQSGAGAVILKSIFEEQIIHDIKRHTKIIASTDHYGDSYDYIAQHVAEDSVDQFFSLINQAKQKLSIPVIGSINCYSFENWLNYAKRFQDAGCDAMELNMAILPYETSLSYDDVDRLFSNIINTLKKSISIPISIKVSNYFTDMAKFMQQLSWIGIDGITIFNKSLNIDIDTDALALKPAPSLSTEGELYTTLRWTAILSKKLRCDLSASTGVHTADDVVKLLLAGATTVQTVSALYKNGMAYLQALNNGLQNWMQRKDYTSIDQFRGQLAIKANEEASMFLRTQFMKYYAEIE